MSRDLDRIEHECLKCWLDGERGSQRGIRRAVSRLDAEARAAYGEGVVRDADSLLRASNHVSRLYRRPQKGSPQWFGHPPDPVLVRESRKDLKKARFYQVLGRWMVEEGWMADDPVLHYDELHPAVMEQERYHYDLSPRQQRKYRRQHGGPPT